MPQSINSPRSEAALGATTPKLGSGPDKPPTPGYSGAEFVPRSGYFHLPRSLNVSDGSQWVPPSISGDAPVGLTFLVPHPRLGFPLKLGGVPFPAPPSPSFQPLLYSPHPSFVDEMPLARGCAFCPSEQHKS